MKIGEVLTDESKWTKGHYAIDSDKEVVNSNAPEAAQFCIIGAIRKSCGDGNWDEKVRIAHAKASSLGFIHEDSTEPFGSLISFNDNPDTTWEEMKQVIELTDKEDK